MSQDQYQNVLNRVGMQPHGKCFTEIPCIDSAGSEHKGNAASAHRVIGLFILDHADRQTSDLQAIVDRDLLVCIAVLNDTSIGFAVGQQHLDVKGSEMIMIFVPRGERFQFAATVKQEFKTVTIAVDL